MGVGQPELLPDDITAELQGSGPQLGLPVLHGHLHLLLDQSCPLPDKKGLLALFLTQ